jgi:hypothetical protein
LLLALIARRDAPLQAYMPVFFVAQLLGVYVLPPVAVLVACIAVPLRWTPLALAVSYHVVTLLVYPWGVDRFLRHHPGWAGWHWRSGASWCDYQYVEIHPDGDPQYAGQVNLFPPYFDIPASPTP